VPQRASVVACVVEYSGWCDCNQRYLQIESRLCVKKLKVFISAENDIICLSDMETNVDPEADTYFSIERISDSNPDEKIEISIEDLQHLSTIITEVLMEYQTNVKKVR
jgi:hypothetical protein